MAYSPNSKNIQLAVADEEFLCPLCCDIFNQPKLLPSCAHSFCKTCLHQLALRSNSFRISCPVCREISKVPSNGIEGFATNTLLVRLIDNIPGRKEKEMVSSALDVCKNELSKNEDIINKLQNKVSQVQQNIDQGLTLKKKISDHANSAIDSIRKWEQKLCNDVDKYLEETSSMHSKVEGLQEQNKKWKSHLEQASSCVKTVEEMLARNETAEIMEMKNFVVEQLQEYSNFPSCQIMEELDEVKDFRIEFQKVEFKQELGRLAEVPESPPLSEPCTLTIASSITVGATASGYDSDRSLTFSETSESSDDTPDVNRCKGQVCSAFPLNFHPFQIAVCPRTGDVALLWEDKNQVHLFNNLGEHMKTIFIRYGDLWDLGFTIDDEIAVVNREHNRLLLYTKDGRYMNFEVEVPRDSLKFTYLSIGPNGELIVTSTKVCDCGDEAEDSIIPCIVVYNNDCEESSRMFGRRVLTRPVSRAVLSNGKYYIGDQCGNQLVIRCFTFQGQHHSNISIYNWGNNVSISSFYDKIFVITDQLSVQGHLCVLTVIQNGVAVQTKEEECPSIVKHAVVINHEPFGRITQAEVYEDAEVMRVVNYFLPVH